MRLLLLSILAILSLPAYAASIDKAESLISDRHYAEARKELTEIITSDDSAIKGRDKAYYLLGKLGYDMGETNYAFGLWDELIRQYPQSPFTQKAIDTRRLHDIKLSNANKNYILDRPFTVNFIHDDKIENARISLALVLKDYSSIDTIESNMSAVRFHLLMLLLSIRSNPGNADSEKGKQEIERDLNYKYSSEFPDDLKNDILGVKVLRVDIGK